MAETTEANPGSNMSDADHAALFLQHKGAYERALEIKKKADADFKNTCKAAKSEIGKDAVDRIKTAISLQGDDGAEKIQERRAMEAEVARWMGMPEGSQGDLFGVDRRPADERAHDLGKLHGMEGKTLTSDYYDMATENGQAYSKGWHEGQEAIFNIGPIEKRLEKKETLEKAADNGGDLDDGDDAAEAA